MKIDDFSNASRELHIEDYFLGETWAWGIFQDRFGNLRREFRVTITGTIDGDVLTLDEDFFYEDGERSRRVWDIKLLGNGKYTGTADDVIGEAIGVASGNALNWQYQMQLPVGDSIWKVSFDDWMFLQADDILINRADVSKFGLNIGTVTLFFSKQAPR